MIDREPAAWLWLKEHLVRLRQATRPGQVPPTGEPAVVVRTAVVTDSAAALPADWVRAFSINGRLAVIPMPVMVGEEIYGEGEDDIAGTIAVALAAATPVKTSRPSPGQFEQAYLAAERHGFESVVSIHISGDLSGTADAARLAAGRVRHPCRGAGHPDRGNGPGTGRAECRGGGGGRPRCRAKCAGSPRSASPRTKVYFYVPSLEQLRRGGRIGAAASLVGAMLSIKPILAVDGGKIVPLEKVRSAAKAVARLEEIVVADAAGQAAGGGAGWPSTTSATRPRPSCLRPGCAAKLPDTPAGADQLPACRAGGPRRAWRPGRDRGGEQLVRGRLPRRPVQGSRHQRC